MKEDSKLSEILKDVTNDFWISNDERKMLIDMLICVSIVLKEGKLHFNGKGKHNKKYADFCLTMAGRFSNMPINEEQ